MILPIGSCRVNSPIRSNSKVGIPSLGFTHSSKEALQMIRHIFLKEGEYFFYEASISPKIELANLNALVIEVCTVKVFYYEENNNRIYVRNSLVESCKKEGYEVYHYIQDYREIVNDLKEIASVTGLPLIIVGHLKPELSEQYSIVKPGLLKLYKVRGELNRYLEESCSEISETHYCEINDIFKKESFIKILKDKENKNSEFDIDLNHYQREAYKFVYDHITESIKAFEGSVQKSSHFSKAYKNNQR